MKARVRSAKERKAMFGRMKGDGMLDHLGGLKIKDPGLEVKNPFAQINTEAAYIAQLGGNAMFKPTPSQLIYDRYANKVLDIDPMDNMI